MSFFTQRYSPLNSLSASLCACEVSWPTLQLIILDWIWPDYVSLSSSSLVKIKVFIVTILKWLDEKSKITMILVFRAIRNTVPSFIRTTFPYFSFCCPESTVVECQRSHDWPVVFRPSCCPTAELPRVTKTQKHHPLWPQHTWLHIQMYRHIHTEDRPSLTN